jgi:mono/diheme cytochrome c family protein
MKNLLIVLTFAITAILAGCGGRDSRADKESHEAEEQKGNTQDAASSYDPKRGEGKYTPESLAIADKLDAAMAAEGEKIANVKCFSCHKISNEKLVGPGWKDVTKRRTPAWIMNFITNPDPMLNKDPEAQAMLEICLVRMPNQNLTDDDARKILEFQRKNDGVN